MIQRITHLVRKHPRLYVIASALFDSKSKELQDLFYNYYENREKTMILMVKRIGDKRPDKRICYMCFGVKRSTKCGFWALMRLQLERLYFFEQYDFVPYVHWGAGVIYYDPAMDNITKNIFEYYFKPVAELSMKEVLSSNEVIIPDEYGRILTGKEEPYHVKEEVIEKLGALYKKYIHLNKNTKAFLEETMKEVLDGRRTLGVHIRGTDYKQGFANHPIVLQPEEILIKTKEVFKNGNYEQIFLATDDQKAYELFQREFGNHMSSYADVMRSDNDESVAMSQSQRPFHHYKLGLEVLRDAYTLAFCNGLVIGLSNVSYAARYINLAWGGRSFEEIIVLDDGIHERDTIRRKLNKLKNKMKMIRKRKENRL